MNIQPPEIIGKAMDPRGGPGPFDGSLVGEATLSGRFFILGRNYEGPGQQFVSALLEFRGVGMSTVSRLKLLPTGDVINIDD